MDKFMERSLLIGGLFLLVVFIIGLISLLISYLKIVWEEKHKVRRTTLTYGDIARVLSAQSMAVPYYDTLCSERDIIIRHLYSLQTHYVECSETGTLPKIIEMHIEPEFFEDVEQGTKNFELRRDKYDIQPGDILVLKEKHCYGETGRVSYRVVKGVYRDLKKYGLRRGYCIISL